MATRKEPTESPPMKALRRFAMRRPEAEEGTSCVNRAFRARGKTFAYLGMKAEGYKLMARLTDSVTRAQALQQPRPEAYDVGKHAWTTIRLPHAEKPPKGLLQGWIAESYRALAPAPLVQQLRGAKAR